MYHLATVFPFIRRFRIPVSRDQAMLLMVAVNEIFLGVDHYLAHEISGTIRPWEALPIIFGPVAGILLILTGIIALRRRTVASVTATVVLAVSIAVGLIGWWLHFLRASVPAGPEGQIISVNLLVWAPPFLGPLTASMIGLIGIGSAWREDPPDSGIFELPGKWRLRLPFSKTRAWFMLVGLGILATLISSVLDHARTGFINWWLWVPVVAGIFATAVSVMLGFIKRPNRGDLIVYTAAMVILILVGLVGAALHIYEDLTTLNIVVPERFIRGAPFLAPLLFSDMGGFGLLLMMDPKEEH